MSSVEALELLRRIADAFTSAGLVVDGEPDCSGELMTCGTTRKPRGTDGRYAVHLDWPPNVWLCNYHDGGEGRTIPLWEKDRIDAMTEAEREALRERIRLEKEAARERLEKRRQKAAETAKRVFRALPIAGKDNAYLSRKGVLPMGDLRQASGGRLVVPVRNAEGALVSLQFITGDGGKRFLSGGEKKGCYCPIPAKDGSKTGPLLVGEGVATILSVCMATGMAGLVAFDAYNLEAVARMARAKYPERELVLCADNDAETVKPDRTPYNPGIEAATAAAQVVGGKLAICPAHEGRATDFNDLHCKRSLEAVRAVVEKAREAGSPVPEDNLPSGFSIRKGGSLPGLWHTEPKEDGDPVETWVGGLLSVLGATRDENGNAWGLLLEWPDDDGNPHTWAMPKAMLAGRDSSAVLARLADEGWRFASGQKARNLFYKFLTEYRTARRVLCVPCTGWHHGAFVFPDTTIKNMSDVVGRVGRPYGGKDLQPSDKEKSCRTLSDGLSAERIVLQVQTTHNPFRMGGTLDGWRATIGTWSRGNSRVMLALCASLAAVLLEPSGMESGGVNWTGASSTGKTTALVAGGSIWGKGASSGGYVQNWRATSNGLEGLAALHSDAALCLDEIGQAPGRTIIEASYMLANGMGKSRAYQDGSARSIRSWRCMVLSTGEKGLAEKIADEGGRVQAGQLVRLIDVPADAGAGMGIFENLHGHESPQAFADAIKRAAATDYGHAARAFIGKMQENSTEAVDSLTRFLAEGLPLISPDAASGQAQRVARRFLLCAAAGEMAAQWGVLPWEKGDALGAVKVCFDAWLALRGGAGAAEDAAILERVALFIEQNGASRFQDVDSPGATCVNRVGFRRKVDDGMEFLVLPESFKAEVCKGHNAKRAAAVLLENGLLLPGEGRNLMRKPPVDLPDYGRKRCYTLLIKEGWQDVAE